MVQLQPECLGNNMHKVLGTNEEILGKLFPLTSDSFCVRKKGQQVTYLDAKSLVIFMPGA